MKKSIEKRNIEEGNISTSKYILYIVVLFLALPLIAGILLIWFRIK